MKIYSTIFLIHIYCISFAQMLRYVDPAGIDMSKCDNPDNPCLTITYALGQANPNDTIRISEGVFTESDGITIDKSIVLQGAGKSMTILQANVEPDTATSRVITIDGAYHVSIIGTTVRHGYATKLGIGSLGGGIYCDSAILVLKDVIINKNYAEKYGGGLYCSSSTITFSGVDFEENETITLSGGGGGISLTSSTGSFTNVSIVKNYAGFAGLGGGILLGGSVLTIDNSGISQNYASAGGGIYAGSGSILLINSSVLENMATYLGGGGIYAAADTLVIRNTLISGNHTDAHGGGLLIYQGYQEFSNVKIRSNRASSSGGGGMYNMNCKPKFEKVVVENNFSYGNGGGMVNEIEIPYTLTGITFRNNEAQGFGGGLFQRGDSLRIQDVLFENNQAQNGGGLYTSGAAFVEHSTFLKNHAIKSGGGMSFDGPLNLSNISFIENTATSGGGGINSGGTFSDRLYPYLYRILFKGNSAQSGGGMINTAFSYPILESVVFDSNSAEYGGGFYNGYGKPIFSNVLFDNNSASYGAGLYHYVDSLTAINTVFIRNVSSTAGGAIYNSGHDNISWMEGKIKLINVTMSQNSSPLGGGIYNIYNSHSDILNSVIWNNMGVQGKNIYNNNISSAALRFSLCGDSLADMVVGEGIGFLQCVHTDPLFVNEDNYRLTPASPCIDSGDPNTDKGIFPGGPSDPVDYDLHPRIINSGIDMGAYEWQDIVSIKKDDPEAHINIYPNPAINSVFIGGNEKVHRITILNLAGQILLQDLNIGGPEKEINISSLEDGLYIMNIVLEKSQLTFKFLKITIK
jgi:predicted outer membrane repeat protein